MKLVIFGAGGKTGTLVTQQALDAGYEVVAYVRRPDSVTLEHENLKVVVGELSDRVKIKAVVAGADACVSTLGGKSLTKRATEFTQGIRHIVDAMEAEGVKRFIYMSSVGAGESRFLMGQPARFMIADVLLRIPLADHTLNEKQIAQSSLDWIVVRPGGLTDGPLSPVVNHGTEKVKIKGSPTISRASVAVFMVAHITDKTDIKKAVWLYA